MNNWPGNKKSLFAGIAFLLAILILISINLLSNTIFRNLRVDLTQDKLFTLSDGTKSMLSTLEERVLLRLYFSQDLANEYPSIRVYARRV